MSAADRRSALLRWLQGGTPARWGTRRAEIDPQRLRVVLDRLDPLFGPGGRFEVDVQGWEHLPPAPSLVVSNHSGGTMFPDAWGFAWAWYRRLGTDRFLHILAHEMLLGTRLTGPFLAGCGALRASRGRALEVLGSWRRDLLVMPGGDTDAWRPWRDRHRVRFAGHRGYARVALQAGVPILPVANVGAHDSLRVLSDGHGLARLLQLHRLFRIDVFPIHLSLPWGLGIGPLPHVPWPVKLRYAIGAAIVPPPRERERPPSEREIEALDRRVRSAVQQLLDGLAHTDAAQHRR